MADRTDSRKLLMETKLHISQEVPSHFISRHHLLARLNAGLTCKLILICAPPGFGKSTLVGEWLRQLDHSVAWLSLDEGDNDPVTFMTYAVAALQRLDARLGQTLADLLEAPEMPAVEVLLTSLLNHIAAAAVPLIWVLDDYHVIANQDIHQTCRFLLDHCPPNLHLVLISRSYPALALPRLHARAQLLLLQAADLCFNLAETTDFFNQQMGLDLSAEELAVLEQRTEGWIAGLRLAALSLQSLPAAHRHAFVMAFNGDHRHVMDYLLEEVLQRQAPAMQELLLQTSILQRICGPLVEAVTGLADPQCNGQACLERLERINLFTMPLDEQRQWYRYHNLFRQVLHCRLQRQCRPDQIAALHLKASAWFARNGLLEPALEHALSADDMTIAVDLMEQCRRDLMNREQWLHLERHLRLFPVQVYDTHPALILARAWLAQSQGRLDSVQSLLERAAEALVAPASLDPAVVRRMHGELDALRSRQRYQAAAGQEAANRARQALETVPGDWRYVRSCAWIRLAGAYQMTGELNDCYAAMVNGRQEARRYPDTSYVYVLREHCALYWMAAELDHLLETATQLLDLGREFNLPETRGWAHYWLGSVYYQRNHLTEAERCFGAVVEHRHLAHVTCVTHSVFGLALTYQAQGLVQQASAAAQLTTECLMEQRNPALTRCVQTFQAELALIQGDLATAGRWLVTVGLHSPLTPQPEFYTSYLTLPKILLAQNTPASRQRALTALTRQCDFFQATHNQRCLIDTLVLLALLFYAEDDVQAAGRAVEQALVLGQAGGFVRAFLDAGERMTQLLGRLSAGRPRVQQFIGELLSLRAQHETVLPSAAPGPVPEPLSERELTVLRLLDSELSGPELAARLFISVNTLKTHLKRIYEKLGARSRYEAVVRAQELGLTKQLLT